MDKLTTFNCGDTVDDITEKNMFLFLRKNCIHIFIWTMMILYIAFAPHVYTYFFVKDGKPVRTEDALPPDSGHIIFNVEDISLITQEGQELYKIWGWAFSTFDKTMSPDMYEREIALTSNSKTHYFPVFNVKRPGVNELYKNLGMNLAGSGFYVLIAKDVLELGEYRLGIVFRDPSTGFLYYADKPKRIIIRTPNKLTLEK
jgi:hypothetical protein